MGVQGLWRLIEPSGKPVPLETLENKVLAVDVSIWLHQIVKGFQDNKGAALPNAHLLGIYHRVCKLLYFRIKPVFVFDGGVPALKRNTIALRNQQKQRTQSEADRIHKSLLSALVKHTAVSKVLSEKAKAEIAAATSPTKKPKLDDDLYVLPPAQLDSTASSEDSDAEDRPPRHFDLHSVDTDSTEFKSLPLDVRHEILTDLKETRKQSSWGRLHELPTQSTDFSGYQMRRLLKRQSVQTALEEVEKEMGGHSLSLGELERLLKDQGVITAMKGSRIASDENTRFLLIKDIKQALEEARRQNLETIEEEEKEGKNKGEQEFEEEEKKNKGEQEFEDDLQRAIALSLEEEPSTSKGECSREVKKVGRRGKNRMSLSFLADFEDADFGESESSEEEEFRTRLTPAQRYMMEYSGLTAHAIAKIIENNSRTDRRNGGDKDVEVADGGKEKSPVAECLNALNEEDSCKSVEKDKDEAVERVDEDLGGETDDCVVATSTGIEETEDADKSRSNEETVEETEDVDKSRSNEESETVELMSESDSGDDFVDVDNKDSDAMEVVIKPDEEIEDDLFKDIFDEERPKPVESPVATTQDKVIEGVQFVSDDEAAEKKDELPEEGKEEPKTQQKSTSQTMIDKIGKMIETYSKPKEQKEVKETEPPKVSVEQLREMKENLTKEQNELVAQRSNKERLAGNITDQMCQEAQELLELFGVPYLVAPMEAEAQCAFLDLIDLTDGTITDDSDIWLFGGRTVYKNFFDQNKIVMEFKVDNIQRHYKLSREQMILLAMLVGSDYTTGLQGVGPVTALEILAAFPPKNHLVSGLAEFKSWFKKGKLPGPGRTSLRGKLKNVALADSFPNPQVVQAYLEPTVETSRERFSWGKPDVPGLVDFARQKFGWTKIKSEEILSPILRRLEDNRVQRSITEYFKYEGKTDSGQAEKMMSKRVKTAVNRIAKGPDCEEEEEKKRITRRKKEGGSGEPKAKKRQVKKKEEDEEVKILKETVERSQKRVAEIQKELSKEVAEKKEKKVNLESLHRKEVIPQRQKEKSAMLKNKMKAIETFRKSKQGPGYVKKRGKVHRKPQNDTSYLSEGSSSD